jgi:type II secretory pathway pseudopilin PulG
LIELLTVLAILSVLISLLQPSLENALRHGSLIQCMNNLRAVSATNHIYHGDHDSFPFSFRYVEREMDYIVDQSSGLWECPSDEGTWSYGGGSPHLKGKTTYMAEESSYWWNEWAASNTNSYLGKKVDLSLNHVLLPHLYTLASCAAIRGKYGGIAPNLHLWHNPNLPEWPIGFADGHAAIVFEPLIYETAVFKKGPDVCKDFNTKQYD